MTLDINKDNFKAEFKRLVTMQGLQIRDKPLYNVPAWVYIIYNKRRILMTTTKYEESASYKTVARELDNSDGKWDKGCKTFNIETFNKLMRANANQEFLIVFIDPFEGFRAATNEALWTYGDKLTQAFNDEDVLAIPVDYLQPLDEKLRELFFS